MSVLTNKDQLVVMAVGGRVSPPEVAVGQFWNPYTPDTEGKAGVPIGMGGIIYNLRVGDSAYGWAGDHVEPGVSISHPQVEHDYALHYLTCIGDEVIVMTGRATGARGTITGEHGRLLADFAREALEDLSVDDWLLVKAKGRGLQFTDYPGIHLTNCSPELVDSLEIRELGRGIEVPVVAEIPSYIMGSGVELGSDFVDQDMMSGDREELARLGIDQLRLGDIVALPCMDHRYGRGYCQNAVSIGIVIHGDSILTGHGAGIQTIMTGSTDQLSWRLDPRSNLADRMKIGNYQG
jgi:hypothetical protein